MPFLQAIGLLAATLTPASPATCPAQSTIGGGEQRDQLDRLLQVLITHLGVTQLEFNHPKRLLQLGADTRRTGFLGRATPVRLPAPPRRLA